MSQKARVKRDPPRRGGPIRNVTMAFRAPVTTGEVGATGETPRPPAKPRVGAARAGAPQAGVVEHAVEIAYRVFDDYMRRGREAANRARPSEETHDPMNNDRRDPASMAMQYWANMAQMWFGYMAPFMPPGMPGRDGWNMGGQCAPEHRREADEKLALAVEVSSEKPAQVTVKLHDKRATRHLEVKRLHPVSGDGPSLTGVHFNHVDGHLRVQVSVPPAFPDGVYEGVIHDREDGTVHGTLQVAIGHHHP